MKQAIAAQSDMRARPMTLAQFRAQIERRLEQFSGGWIELQHGDPDSFPKSLPFEEWWCDFMEDVDCQLITGRAVAIGGK